MQNIELKEVIRMYGENGKCEAWKKKKLRILVEESHCKNEQGGKKKSSSININADILTISLEAN